MTLLNLPACAFIGIVPVSILILFLLWQTVGLSLGKWLNGEYRIVERKYLNNSEFIVQRKCFHVWKDESYFTDNDYGCGYGDFKTLQEAKDYVNWQRGSKEKVVE